MTFRVLAPFAPGCREFFNPSAGLRPRGTTARKFGSGPRGGPVSILAPAAVQGGANLMDVWLAVNLPGRPGRRYGMGEMPQFLPPRGGGDTCLGSGMGVNKLEILC